ncbi:MAG TPA: gliding motility protein [Sphingobacteriaceae bacterium]|nr:gliding motility protein [Sphingobacteriaceae bacterium]
MRKLTASAFIILSCSNFVSAQTDATAKAILAQVSKKYRSYDIIKTDFTYTLDNPQAKMKETQAGTIYVKSKTNKYKIILKDQELISDGKTQWNYLKTDKEVQVSNFENDPNSINPAKIFTIYEKGYKYVSSDDTKINGKIYNVIDLTPLDTKSSYFKIRLNIDRTTRQIGSAVIFDKNGNKYTYTIGSFTPNFKASESIFTFDAKQHPGVEVVDLR